MHAPSLRGRFLGFFVCLFLHSPGHGDGLEHTHVQKAPPPQFCCCPVDLFDAWREGAHLSASNETFVDVWDSRPRSWQIKKHAINAVAKVLWKTNRAHVTAVRSDDIRDAIRDKILLRLTLSVRVELEGVQETSGPQRASHAPGNGSRTGTSLTENLAWTRIEQHQQKRDVSMIDDLSAVDHRLSDQLWCRSQHRHPTSAFPSENFCPVRLIYHVRVHETTIPAIEDLAMFQDEAPTI
mmetsp:Transcript_12695/g.35101  ORF Transcript_12695/g.35101 Transcript_12695/m.35101 type:complete len:238 (+) Transcript_12695:178-891(+)